jgi:hypothetical protein
MLAVAVVELLFKALLVELEVLAAVVTEAQHQLMEIPAQQILVVAVVVAVLLALFLVGMVVLEL